MIAKQLAGTQGTEQESFHFQWPQWSSVLAVTIKKFIIRFHGTSVYPKIPPPWKKTYLFDLQILPTQPA